MSSLAILDEKESPVSTPAAPTASLDALNDGALLQVFLKSADEQRELAFTELVRRHSGLVLGHCRRRLNDPGAAEDATQAVFVLLAKKAASLSKPGSLSGWLYRTSELVTRSMKRARCTRQQYETTDRRGLLSPADPEKVTALKQQLDDALLHLNAKERESILLHYLQGLSQQEAAQALGLTYPAYRQRLSRALENVRTFVSSRGAVFSASALGVALMTIGKADAAQSAASFQAVCTQAGLGQFTPSVQAIVKGVLHHMLQKTLLSITGIVAVLVLGFSAALFGADSHPQNTKATSPVTPPQPRAETAEPQTLATLKGDHVMLNSVKGVGRPVFSPDGQWLAVREQGNKLALIELVSALKDPAYQPQRFEIAPQVPLDPWGDRSVGECAMFSEDGQTLLFATTDGLMSVKRPFKTAAQAVAGVTGWFVPAVSVANKSVSPLFKVLRPGERGGGRGNREEYSAEVQLVLYKNGASGKDALIDGPKVRPDSVVWSPTHEDLWVTLEDGAAATVASNAQILKQFDVKLLEKTSGKAFEAARIKTITPDGKYLVEGTRLYPPEMKDMMGTYVPGNDEAPERGRNPGSAEGGPHMPRYLFVCEGEKCTKLWQGSTARGMDTLWTLPSAKADRFLYFQVANLGAAGHGEPHAWLGQLDQTGKRTEKDLGNPFLKTTDAPVFELLEIAPDASKALVFMQAQREKEIPNELDDELKKQLKDGMASGQINGAAHGGPEALMQMLGSGMLFRKYERAGGTLGGKTLGMTFFTWQVLELDAEKQTLRNVTPEFGEAIGKLENVVSAPGAPNRHLHDNGEYSKSAGLLAINLKGMRTATTPGPFDEPRGLMLIKVTK